MTSTDPFAADPAPGPGRRSFDPEGERGAVLRCERPYHSQVTERRAARDAGGLACQIDRRTSPARPKKSAAHRCWAQGGGTANGGR